jgi:cytochrome d ubiquinol oxidase subunit I
VIGGIPDEEKRELNYAIRIPGGLSWLAHGDINAEVMGLDRIPDENQPPVLIPDISFQIMVGLGMLMALTGIIFLLFRWKWKHNLDKKWWLVFIAVLTPLGFIVVEAGWMVTEVARQPWIIRGVMKTADAVTPMPGVRYIFYLITILYLFLSFMAVWLLSRQIKVVNEKYSQGIEKNTFQ